VGGWPLTLTVEAVGKVDLAKMACAKRLICQRHIFVRIMCLGVFLQPR
jgi:hypothetical protein